MKETKKDLIEKVNYLEAHIRTLKRNYRPKIKYKNYKNMTFWEGVLEGILAILHVFLSLALVVIFPLFMDDYSAVMLALYLTALLFLFIHESIIKTYRSIWRVK